MTEKLTNLPDGGGYTELGKLRMHARALLEACDDYDLAKAINEGNAIDSYQPYVDWLQRQDHGELYLQQLVEYILYVANKPTLIAIASRVMRQMEREIKS